MLSITARNVNEVFPVGMMYLRERGVKLDSRNGPVLEYPEPVSIKYTAPRERVLFDKNRRINPFLHFFEPLWILAGRDDVAFLSNIVSRFKEYSDNGVTFHGAYGRRMRYPVDQIDGAISILKSNPDDRRVVLQIRRDNDMFYTGRDVPCNTSIACKVRNGKLNIHVFNRSNDYIWGMTGANMPQFSVLQEYIASSIGVEVGVYHQTTDSMHVYTEGPQWGLLKNTSLVVHDPYEDDGVLPFPLFSHDETQSRFDRDLRYFFDNADANTDTVYQTRFFGRVAEPMWATFKLYKAGRKDEAMKKSEEIAALDWRIYVQQWLGGK